jgi:hypothetical protein
MATRMQQRRGTAAQWISTNGGAGPVLNAGEMGWESDTNKFKIGDGVNNWSNLDYFADINSTVNPAFGSSITFEGATANDFETTLAITDPTADRTITLPDVTGTVITTGNLSDITNIGVFTSTITMEGSTANDFELTLSAGDPTADRTITFPDATGTVALTSDITVTASSTNTLSNKSISLATNTVTGTKAEFNSAMSDADFATIAGSETLTNKTLTTPVISSITNGAATLTLPTSTGTIALTTDIPAGVVTESGTQTLTNKTLTSPVVSGLTISDASIVLEGTTADAHETTLTVGDPTADRTITLPDATGTVVLRDTTDTLTNKTLTSPVITGAVFNDGSIVFEGATADDFETTFSITDPTADRTITFPDATGTVALAANVAALSGATFTGAVSGTDLTLSGNLTVNGTTTNINSTNLVVEDKNIVLADVETPTDTTADGGGITLKGTTDKTLNWVDATDAWTSSEDFNLLTGKVYKIAGTSVLSATTLGSGVTGSSLTSVGTITSGTWTGTAIAVANGGTGSTSAENARTALGLVIGTDVQAYNSTLAAVAGGNYTGDDSITTLGTISAGTWTGTTIAIANGGTGQTTASAAANALLPSQTDNSGKYLTTDGSGTLSWGTVSGYSAPTLGSTSIASGATVTTISGLTLSSAIATTALTLNATAELRLADTDSSNYVGFKSPGTVAANKVWTLPAADGTAGQVLSTDGSATLSWATAAGGGGADEILVLMGAL